MSARDELLKIHAILQAPGDCPESTDDDTLTVRMLKDVIHAWHSERRMKPPQNAAQTEAIALAYGYLWHGNVEPFAPIPTYTPQRAAYDARKILRDTMTHEQRGEAINKVRAMLETPNYTLTTRPHIGCGASPAPTGCASSGTNNERTDK
jgi:hypothetical protein